MTGFNPIRRGDPHKWNHSTSSRVGVKQCSDENAVPRHHNVKKEPLSREKTQDKHVCPCCQRHVLKDVFHTHVSSCFMGIIKSSGTKTADQTSVVQSIESIRTQVNRIDLHQRINMMQSLCRLAIATKPRRKNGNSLHPTTNPALQLNLTNFDNQMLEMLFSEPNSKESYSRGLDSSPTCSPIASPTCSPMPSSPLMESLDESLFPGRLEPFDFDSIGFACDMEKESFADITCRESSTPVMSHADPFVSRKVKRRDSDLHRDLDQFYDVMAGKRYKTQ